MAEALLRRRLTSEFEVRSAGTHAFGGVEPTATAVEVMQREAGIEIHGQRSKELTAELIEWADHIFTMSTKQAQVVAALVVGADGYTRLFGAFAPGIDPSGLDADPGGPEAGLLEVPDPMGGKYGDYLECMQRLEVAADQCAGWLITGAEPSAAPAPIDAT